MFDIGMSEMIVIGVVALIVVGPKDLPQMFRKVGQFVGKARGMARDFQRAMDQAADEAGGGDISASVKQATSMKNLGLDDAAKHLQDFQSSFEKSKEPKKVDAAAEHTARVKSVDEANKAAEQWPPEGAEVPEPEPDKVSAPGKPAAKKAAAKKPVVKKIAAKKSTAKKASAKTAAAKKTTAKKPAVKKTTKSAKAKT